MVFQGDFLKKKKIEVCSPACTCDCSGCSLLDWSHSIGFFSIHVNRVHSQQFQKTVTVQGRWCIRELSLSLHNPTIMQIYLLPGLSPSTWSSTCQTLYLLRPALYLKKIPQPYCQLASLKNICHLDSAKLYAGLKCKIILHRGKSMSQIKTLTPWFSGMPTTAKGQLYSCTSSSRIGVRDWGWCVQLNFHRDWNYLGESPQVLPLSDSNIVASKEMVKTLWRKKMAILSSQS